MEKNRFIIHSQEYPPACGRDELRRVNNKPAHISHHVRDILQCEGGAASLTFRLSPRHVVGNVGG